MKKKLLIVDDDSSLRDSISNYLTYKGFEVDSVDSVQSALQQIFNKKPDMVITDVMMPSINGYDFVQMLRSDTVCYKIPIILLTAKGMTQDRIKGYDLGCNAYLAKPFDPNELISIINNLFNNIGLTKLAQKQKVNYSSVCLSILPFKFTDRELAVLQLLVQGYTNREIARSLYVSVRNIEKYVSRLLHKTSTRNRTELAQQIISKNILLSKGE